MPMQRVSLIGVLVVAVTLGACGGKPKEATPELAAPAEVAAEPVDTTVAAEVPAEATTAPEGTPAEPAK